MKTKLTICLALLAVIISVHSQPQKSDLNALQGTWLGTEEGTAPDAHSVLKISGDKLDFVGTDTNDWCKGTFTLHEDTNPKQFVGVIKACPSPDGIGVGIFAIYSIKDGKFTISGSSPGETNFPSSFDAPGARKIVFQRKEDIAKSTK